MPDSANSDSRGVILIIVTIGTFLNPFTGSSINLALPLIGEEFAIDAVMLSWIPAAYLLSTAIFLLPAGMLGDIIGRARVFSTGTLVYTFASLLAFFAPSASLLLACRFLQGIGGAMLYSTAIAIIAELYSPGERGRAVGINVMAVYGGMTLGPFIGGILTQLFGWRSIFFITVLLGCIVLLYVRRFPAILNEKRRETFDYQGAILSAVALVLFFIGISLIPAAAAAALIIAAGVTFLILYYIETRKSSPLFPIVLLSSNRTFSFSNLAALINYSATFAVTFLMSLYLQVVRGMSPAAAGSILLIQPFIQMVIAPVAGRLSDRTDASKLAFIGLLTSSMGLLGLSFIVEDTPLSWVVLFLVLLGCGLGLFSTPNTTVIMGSVDRHNYGVASSLLATMRNTGMMVSMGIVMIFFSLMLGSTSINPEMSQGFLASMQLILLVFFVLTLLGAVISLDKKSRLPG
ncbi:MAG: MFS transporter [Methanoregulaceae archaeon]|nr:MFS transporter [Methanoregulaceae archaeon]